jgi:hypothetical protein
LTRWLALAVALAACTRHEPARAVRPPSSPIPKPQTMLSLESVPTAVADIDLRACWSLPPQSFPIPAILTFDADGRIEQIDFFSSEFSSSEEGMCLAAGLRQLRIHPGAEARRVLVTLVKPRATEAGAPDLGRLRRFAESTDVSACAQLGRGRKLRARLKVRSTGEVIDVAVLDPNALDALEQCVASTLRDRARLPPFDGVPVQIDIEIEIGKVR